VRSQLFVYVVRVSPRARMPYMRYQVGLALTLVAQHHEGAKSALCVCRTRFAWGSQA
jgi:hypothetical protein